MPSSLLKAYPDQEYADAFMLNGVIQLKSIQYFRKVEGSRQDESEGEARLLVPGQVPVITFDKATGKAVGATTIESHFQWSGQFHNPTYLFCTARHEVDRPRLRAEFGQHVVQITETPLFVQALQSALERLEVTDREVTQLDAFPVRYDKGLVGTDPLNGLPNLRLHYGQKTPPHTWEYEYRFAVVLSGPRNGAPEHLDLALPNASSYVRLAP